MFFQYFTKPNLLRFVLLSLGVGVVFYAFFVIIHVSTSYELGIRTILTPHLIDMPLNVKTDGKDDGPRAGDLIKKIGDYPISTWKDILQAPRNLHDKIQAGHRTDADLDFIVVEYTRSGDPHKIRT